jgi:hypothetical protein
MNGDAPIDMSLYDPKSKGKKPQVDNNQQITVMEIRNNQDYENNYLLAKRKNSKIYQQWDLIYVDEYPKEPVKGELNKEFGFYVERDFYIVSQMKSNRYLEVIDNKQVVIKTPNGNKGQTWYFDQKSKTVKTRLNNRSFDIQSSGKGRNFQVWSTNSRWW